LAQMLWLRRLARGRTAEVIGERGLQSDRLARTLGIGRLADAQLARMDAESVAVLEAYSEGVNARVARVVAGEDAAPLSLVGPGEDFDPWSAADCIAIVKLIAWSSGNRIETGLALEDLVQQLGGVAARPFRPANATARGLEVPHEFPSGSPARYPVAELVAPSRDLSESTALVAGTAWVLAPRHSASGAAILVADLHLPPTLPSLLYEIHLRGGSVDVAGATVPGVPVVWAGRNLHVAWAVTPARAGTVDLYRETLRESQGSYQNGSLWVPLEEREEIIRVRAATGGPREERLRVRLTRHGPLVDGLLAAPGSEPATGATSTAAGGRGPLALAWTGALPGDGIASLLGVARAREGREVVAALAAHHEPVIALVYADDHGSAGVQMAGWLPSLRAPTALSPVEGRMRSYDWRAGLDYGVLPASVIDPSRPGGPGWLIVADNDLEADHGGEISGGGIEWLWRNDRRARRLRLRLEQLVADGRSPLDLRAAAAVQNDMLGGARTEVVPALLRLARAGGELAPEAEEIATLLERWDGTYTAGSRGAAAYSILMEHLIEELFRDAFGPTLLERYLALPHTRPAFVVESLLVAAERARMPGGWTDQDRVQEALRKGLRRTWVSLSHRLGPNRERWRWGGLHRLAFRPFAGFGGEPFRGASWPRTIAVGGDATTLASVDSLPVRGFPIRSAASYRLVVDLAAPDRMLSSLAPGQSEHLGHPQATDGIDRWLEGRPSLLVTSRLLIEEESGGRLLLEPSQ